MTEKTKKFISNPSFKRALFMILFFIIGRFSAIAVFLIAIFQFFHTLIYKKQHERIMEFSKSLSIFIKDIIDYLMMNTDEKPWPFNSWKK